MILEAADLRAPEGASETFEAEVRRGLDTVLSRADGYRRYELRRSIETPDRYLLLIEWESLEHHTVGFRESAAYEEWSAIVRPVFAGSPSVEHFELIAASNDAER